MVRPNHRASRQNFRKLNRSPLRQTNFQNMCEQLTDFQTGQPIADKYLLPDNDYETGT